MNRRVNHALARLGWKEELLVLWVGAFSYVSLKRLACKTVCCILDRKRRQIEDEWTLSASSDFSWKRKSSLRLQTYISGSDWRTALT